MKLQELASLLLLSTIEGDPTVEFTRVQFDSRLVQPGDLFICLPGHTVDGHEFAAAAIEKGAVALVVQQEVDVQVPKLVVKDSRYAMAVIANHFYGYPTHEMKIIGVTGTNGKTTTTFLIEKILSDAGLRTGLMGTIQMKIGDERFEVKNTTQDALDLQRNFRKMQDVGTDAALIEVSSHALEMGRVKGVHFRTAIFTNLTQDHLDYHKTMENYKAAKGLFFSRLGNEMFPDPSKLSFAVLNSDDEASETYQQLTAAQVITYGINNNADVRAKNIQITAKGTRFHLESFRGNLEFQLQLIGKFSVYNALAAISACLIEGIPLKQIRRSLEEVKGVDGRFEAVQEGQDFLVVVDYAHTPDSLENVLATIREFAQGKVYCVFGCGGDRDRTKRPIMARIAMKYSDYVIATSDNPRSEEPEAILADIENGLKEANEPHKYEMIVDRKQAIAKAVQLAKENDVVLIAGKGHETYQIIKGVTYDFDDRLVAKEAIRSLNG